MTEKNSLSLELVKWLERQGTWKRNSGKDHVFVLGKISWDFRACFIGWILLLDLCRTMESS